KGKRKLARAYRGEDYFKAIRARRARRWAALLGRGCGIGAGGGEVFDWVVVGGGGERGSRSRDGGRQVVLVRRPSGLVQTEEATEADQEEGPISEVQQPALQ